jgi:hypothetical protein
MRLKTSCSERMRLDVGHWYVVNTRINGIVQAYKHMHLEDISREVGVLQDWEEVRFED